MIVEKDLFSTELKVFIRMYIAILAILVYIIAFYVWLNFSATISPILIC